jgi:hypothetical protein
MDINPLDNVGLLIHAQHMSREQASIFADQASVEASRRMLNEHEAAEMLGVSVALLRRWRWLRQGPRYRKCGRRVLYQIRDLDSYISSLPAGGAKVA